jgi:hypothetical protein
MTAGRDASEGIFGWTTMSVRANSGSRRDQKQGCDCRRVVRRLSFRIWLGLLLATRLGTATAGVIPFHVNAIPEERLASDEQPAPAQGPGPVSPIVGAQAPPTALPSTGEATEVPIGRPEGYEEEKQKALEIPFRGSPPGAIQEDPGVSPRRTKTGSCGGR